MKRTTQRATMRMRAYVTIRLFDWWLAAPLWCRLLRGVWILISGWPRWTAVRGLAVIVACASTTGCDDLRLGEIEGLRHDTMADVAIVESVLNVDRLQSWSVHEYPDVVIGDRSDEGGTTLYRVNDVRLLAGGGIVAMNGHELVWFDEGGRWLTRGGGRGEGPSQSLSILGMDLLAGDSLIVISRRPPSLKIFGPSGEFIRSMAARIPPNVVAMYRFGVQGWIGISFGGEFPSAATGVFYELWHVVHYATEFESADTLLSLDGRMLFGDRRESVYVPGGPSAYFASRGDVMVAGESATYELLVFDGMGELQHVIRNVTPNPTDLELALPSATRLPVGVEGGRRKLQTPTVTAPAYDGVLVATDGMIWVRRRAGPDGTTVWANAPWSSAVSRGDETTWVAEGFDGQEWHVYDDSGAIRASVVLPARLRPTEITSSVVIGVWKDDLGVETIRMFRLIGR